MWKEFKKFALRGSVIDLAVGIVIGTAFKSIVDSLVNDILMPPIGWLLGGINFQDLYLTIARGTAPGPYASLAEAQEAGAVTINYGLFINSLVSFLIITLALFLVVRGVNRLQRKKEEQAPEPTTKTCPFCQKEIPLQASRCPHCTSQLEE